MRQFRLLGICLLVCLLLAHQSEESAVLIKHPKFSHLQIPSESQNPYRLGPTSGTTAVLPNSSGLLELIQSQKPEDWLLFLETCLRRYDREVQSYRVTLVKHERVGGTPTKLASLRDPEEVECWFREHPFSVLMRWRRGAGIASSSLYVKGENNDQLLARTRLLGLVVTKDPAGWEVKRSTRYPPTEFGFKMGTLRVLKSWRAAHLRGTLKVRFEGEQPIPALGNKVCWVIRRIGYTFPEDDGITETVFYFDPNTWLMLGSELKGVEGKFLASYYFTQLHLNPPLPSEIFTRVTLLR